MTKQVNLAQVVEDLKVLLEQERESQGFSLNPEYFEGKVQAIKEVIEYLIGEDIE